MVKKKKKIPPTACAGLTEGEVRLKKMAASSKKVKTQICYRPKLLK